MGRVAACREANEGAEFNLDTATDVARPWPKVCEFLSQF